MSFSDLVHRIETDVAGLATKAETLLPAGLPSDTREVAALAEEAGKVAVTLDPELEPIFQAIGSVGNIIEGALHELGGHIGSLKAKLAERAAVPVAGGPVPPPPGQAPVGVPDPAAPQPAAAGAQPTVNDLKRAADAAALARQADPAAAEATDPNPLPAAPAAPPTYEAPAPADASTSPESTPLASTSTGPAPVPTAPLEQVPTSAELEQAEAAFAALSPEDKAAFEGAEGLEEIPPAPEQIPPPA